MKHDLEMADLFAGGGGFSTGIAEACKELHRTPSLVAINHWKVAVDTHRRNHPWARHLCTGLETVNPTDVAPARLSLLCASPECTHHSNARGGKPMNDQSRASAWLILKWLQELYVEAVLIENVEEFCEWGPLGANGRPLKSMRGELFIQFINSLKALGYNVEWRVVNSANHGAWTTRERLFIMARRGGNKRIIWPDATHSKTGSAAWDRKRKAYNWEASNRWRPAREIIDWNIPSQSIFKRKKPLAKNTLARIEAGLQKFNWPDPFLVILRNHMDAQSIDRPLPTLTASGQHVGLCQPFMLGQQSGATARGIDSPVPTVATDGAISLIQPFVMSMEHAPQPFVTQLVHKDSGHERRTHDVNAPMPTITTVDAWGVVEPFMIPNFGEREGQTPRTHGIDSPLPTVTSHGAGGLVEPFIVEYHGSHLGRNDGDRRAISTDGPLPTQTTENRFGLAEPFIVPQFGEARAKSVDDPLGTITTTSRGIGLAEPFIISYYGTENMSGVYRPLPTVTTKDRFGLVQQYAFDIHFRMLHWRELARAMGFPDWYEFEGTRSDKVRQIGNSVEVRTAKALAMAALAS